MTHANFLILGYSENETLVNYLDTLCDYARAFGDAEYHKIARWSEECIDKYGGADGGNVLLNDLSEDVITDLEIVKMELAGRIYINPTFTEYYNRWFQGELQLKPKHPKYEIFPTMLAEFDAEFMKITSEFNIWRRILMQIAWRNIQSLSDIAFKLLSSDAKEEFEDWNAFRVISLVRCIQSTGARIYERIYMEEKRPLRLPWNKRFRVFRTKHGTDVIFGTLGDMQKARERVNTFNLPSGSHTSRKWSQKKRQQKVAKSDHSNPPSNSQKETPMNSVIFTEDATAFEKAVIASTGLLFLSLLFAPLGFLTLGPLTLIIRVLEIYSGHFFGNTEIAIASAIYITVFIMGFSLMIESAVKKF